MTREDLREYCKNQIEIFEQFEVTTYKAPFKRERYERCKFILELLDQEQKADNEWCTDCKDYDHEKHCCPRFSQVIKTTLQECCEDAISREDVLLMLTGEDLPDDASKLISILSERIKKLPLVKPEQKRGHWIYQTSDDYLGELNRYYERSECGRTVRDTVGDIYTEYPYCHCGAKMVKDGEK